MRVRTNFPLLFLFTYFLSSILSSAQTPLKNHVSARLLDANLQECAFKSFSTPKTGVPYDANVPSNLTGIKVSALRLRSGSLKTRGFERYKEFEIPKGVIEKPYVKSVTLVYQNLGNWSQKIYPLDGYSYLAPILGLLAYDATNLYASKLDELELRASSEPILVKFPYVKKSPQFGVLPKCVYFDLYGYVKFDTLLNGNVCSIFQHGHVSIVVESNSSTTIPSESGRGNKKFKLRILISSLVVGIVWVIILGLVIIRIIQAKEERKIKQLELEIDCNRTWNISSIGDTKAPLALGTRTRPMIENDYVP
ncbi:uncharacterized protein [Cicer arietinum]|uniref:Uncharacterized protein LOC101509471 n=1 Tax=Cicer arietinum TaxID=3827 RepID=A0A1S2XMX7_CICAR|nr:uncharacterized protein LOC101509471 [Cicer arietinum]